jgi:hypothetical protein
MRFSIWIPRTPFGLLASILAGLTIAAVLHFGLFGAPSNDAPAGTEANFRDQEALFITFVGALAGGSWIGTRLDRWRLSREVQRRGIEGLERAPIGAAPRGPTMYWIPRTLLGVLASVVAGAAIGVVLHLGPFGAPSIEVQTTEAMQELNVEILIIMIVASVGGLWIGTSLERWRTRSG